MTMMIVGFFLSITLVVGVVAGLNQLMNNGLYDLIIDGLLVLTDLFGTGYTILFVSLFTLAGMTLVIRWILSRMGENPGQSANKG